MTISTIWNTIWHLCFYSLDVVWGLRLLSGLLGGYGWTVGRYDDSSGCDD